MLSSKTQTTLGIYVAPYVLISSLSIPSHTHHRRPSPQFRSLCIKGLPDDDAVLCTSESTFAIREVQLSNSLLLVSPLPHSDINQPMLTEDDSAAPEIWSVQDNLSSTIELTPCLPRLERLNELLGASMYAGPEAESQHSQVRACKARDLSLRKSV